MATKYPREIRYVPARCAWTYRDLETGEWRHLAYATDDEDDVALMQEQAARRVYGGCDPGTVAVTPMSHSGAPLTR